MRRRPLRQPPAHDQLLVRAQNKDTIALIRYTARAVPMINSKSGVKLVLIALTA